MISNKRYDSWEDAGINIMGINKPIVYLRCPHCSDDRKPHNQKKPCLRVNIEKNNFQCYNECGFDGYIAPANGKAKTYSLPQPLPAVKDPITDEWAKYFFKRGIALDTLRKMKCQNIEYAFPQDIEYGENNAKIYHKSSAIVFPYIYKESVVFHKYRGLNKQFSTSLNPQLIFWNLNCLLDNQNGKKFTLKPSVPYVIICEGEIDALTWIQAGYEYVVSVPNGGTKSGKDEYVDTCIEYFKNVKTFYLALDSDEIGRALRERLSRRFGRENSKMVEYPFDVVVNGVARKAKDINEVLEHYSEKEVKSCYENATWHPIKGVESLSDYEAKLDAVYADGRRPFYKIGLPLDEIFTWNMGESLTIISGIPQSAKSQLTFNVAIRMAYFYGMKWAIFSPETGEADEIAQRLIEILMGEMVDAKNTWRLPQINATKYAWAKAFINTHFHILTPVQLEDLSFGNFLDTLEALIRRYGINGGICDPVNNLEDIFGNGSEMMSKALSTNLRNAKFFCAKHDFHLILVPHPASMQSETKMTSAYQINGGAAWYNHADNIIFSNRELGSGNPIALRGDDIDIVVEKCKKAYAGRKGTVKHAYHFPTGIFGSHVGFGDVLFENHSVWSKKTAEKQAKLLNLEAPKEPKRDFLAHATAVNPEIVDGVVQSNTLSLSGEDVDDEIPF